MKTAALAMTWIHLAIGRNAHVTPTPTPAMVDYALDCSTARATGMWL